ncbi:MAG: hypothetical protein QXP31_11990, partial [Pyrobaculum sp.]
IGGAFGIPFFNMPYPFLLETFKLSIVSSLFASIYLLEQTKWRYLALLLSFLIEPEVLILLLIIYIIASKNKEIANLTILGVTIFVYTILHREVIQNLNLAYNIIIKEELLLLIPILVIPIKYVINRLKILDRISQFFINKIILYLMSLILFILLMQLTIHGFSYQKILLISNLATLLIQIDLYSKYVKIHKNELLANFITLILFLEIFSVIGILGTFTEIANRLNAFVFQFFIIYVLKHKPKIQYNISLLYYLLSFLFYLSLSVPWFYINYPGAFVNYDYAFEIGKNIDMNTLLIAPYNVTISFLSTLKSAIYIFPCFECNINLSSFSSSLERHDLSFKIHDGHLLIINLTNYNRVVFEINDKYRLVINGKIIDPSILSFHYYACNNSRITVEILSSTDALIRYFVFNETGIYYIVKNSYTFTCNNYILLIMSHQFCIKCGLDSYPRVVLMIPRSSSFIR